MTSSDSEIVVTAVKRANTLRALSEHPLARSELQADIGVSRTTTHRIVRDLTEKSLVRRVDGNYELTPLGRIVATEVGELQDTVELATRLEPLLPALDGTGINVELFTDATITVQEPGDPYRPVRRFVSLLRDSETLRGFDTTTIAPMYVDEIRENIFDGMQTEIIYLPTVIDQLFTDHREATSHAIEIGNLDLLVHEQLPFGLVMFDDRIGIGGYDDTGVLRIFADTTNPDVRTWAESLYEQYYEEAMPLEEPSDSDAAV
ncbi:helix-turn-helix transcriptional regulator [Haladaptatus cibarius]|uniref:helix-turn-helix transcriptional regulator n=1 Tax=Haladaptatus cibarius TaxID=453847 RepID=UPI0006787572|nr:helix-turn-helix domain-containing protein [Haladaptatus cibarius]